MSPQEAIQLVDNVLANVNGTRADHVKIQMATSVLRDLVNGTTPPDENAPQDDSSEKEAETV